LPKAPPKIDGPRLPLEAPSKFSLRKSLGGDKEMGEEDPEEVF